jgi:hypothetical protein
MNPPIYTDFAVADGAVGPAQIIDGQGARLMTISWDNPAVGSSYLRVIGYNGDATAGVVVKSFNAAVYQATSGTPHVVDVTGYTRFLIDATNAVSTTGTCSGKIAFQADSGAPYYMRTDQRWTQAKTSDIWVWNAFAVVGPTALFTPSANRKFELLGYRIMVGGDATLAGGGLVTVTLGNNGTSLNMGTVFYAPAIAQPGMLADTGWIRWGVRGPVPIDPLTVALSAALGGAGVQVQVAGIQY